MDMELNRYYVKTWCISRLQKKVFVLTLETHRLWTHSARKCSRNEHLSLKCFHVRCTGVEVLLLVIFCSPWVDSLFTYKPTRIHAYVEGTCAYLRIYVRALIDPRVNTVIRCLFKTLQLHCSRVIITLSFKTPPPQSFTTPQTSLPVPNFRMLCPDDGLMTENLALIRKF